MIIPLTTAQQILLRPRLEAMSAEGQAGRPGMLIAQVYADHLRIEDISHEDAIAMLRATGRSLSVTYHYGSVVCHE